MVKNTPKKAIVVLGGALIMNAGAYGSEISNFFSSVRRFLISESFGFGNARIFL